MTKRAGNYRVVRNCCSSGNCSYCRGVTPPGQSRRVVQIDGINKQAAERVAKVWKHHAPMVEKWPPGPTPARDKITVGTLTFKAPAIEPTVTLWYFDFCLSNLGIWDRMWAASKAKLEAERRQLKSINSKIDRRVTPAEKMDGSYGQHGPAQSVEVTLTAEGILQFACNYAIDQGAC